MVNVWLESYLKSFPDGRVMVLCTDDRALRHLQDELQDETLCSRGQPRTWKGESWDFPMKMPETPAERAGIM